MITTPTVFILGAGASIPYGFPSGESLITLILNYLNQVLGAIETNSMLPNWYDNSVFSYDELKNFQVALLNSNKNSIDSFLEFRPEFSKIGKLLIALVLLKAEDKNKFADNDDHWYKYIWNKMPSSFDDFHLNNISFITFNYDRSLEYFLTNSLKHTFGKTEAQCWEQLKKLDIIHLHGKLGLLPFENQQNSIDFGQQRFSTAELFHASENIKIIHENIEYDEDFQKTFKLLNESKRIYFLGFGYHYENLERLQLKKTFISNKFLAGSSYQMGLAEMEEVKDYLNHGEINLRYFGFKNLGFLKQGCKFN